MRNRKTSAYWLSLLIVGGLVALTFLNLRLGEEFKHQDHFAPRWTAARAWMRDGSSPYSDEVHAETLQLLEENGFQPGEFSQAEFLEPAYNLYFYIPLSFLSYSVARAIWMVLIELALVLSAWFSVKLAGSTLLPLERLALVLIALLWYPAFKLALTASAVPIYVLLVLYGSYLALQDRGTSAGILFFLILGLMPISVVVAIFLLIWRGAKRDNSMLLVFFAGITFLLVTSLILFPGWIPDWFGNFVSLHPDLSWIDTPLSRIAALFPGATNAISTMLHLAFLMALLIEWYGIAGGDDRQTQWKLLLTLNILYFFIPYAPAAYLLLVWPAMFLFKNFLGEKWRISGKIIFWLVITALVYVYLQDFFRLDNWSDQESSWLVLGLPILTLLGLQWTRWWALKSPKPLLDNL